MAVGGERLGAAWLGLREEGHQFWPPSPSPDCEEEDEVFRFWVLNFEF